LWTKNLQILINVFYNVNMKLASKSFFQKYSWYLGLVLVAILLIIVLWWFNILPFNVTNITAAKKYQAVFLSNGQVYFGELRGEKGDYAILASIYYLQQVNQPVQQTASASVSKDNKNNQILPQADLNSSPDVRLVKLGSELHGPEDMMYIAKSHILFYEDLKDNSRVVQAIKAFENK